jgi:hypothetical protein
VLAKVEMTGVTPFMFLSLFLYVGHLVGLRVSKINFFRDFMDVPVMNPLKHSGTKTTFSFSLRVHVQRIIVTHSSNKLETGWQRQRSCRDSDNLKLGVLRRKAAIIPHVEPGASSRQSRK